MHTTREGWLTKAMEAMERELLAPLGLEMHRTLVSCGFPYNSTTNVAGQCFPPRSKRLTKRSGPFHIFISPGTVGAVTCRAGDIYGQGVLPTLLHEMLHVVDRCESGHGPAFARLCRLVGLEGRPTSTHCARGSDLDKYLRGLARRLGRYPHRPIRPATKPSRCKRVRLVSKVSSAYRVEISPDRLFTYGEPTCPWGEKMKLIPEHVEIYMEHIASRDPARGRR